MRVTDADKAAGRTIPFLCSIEGEMMTDTQPQAFPLSAAEGVFVAINFIRCDDEYRERFEALFRSRAHAIDRLPGFLGMNVLKPKAEAAPNEGEYLVISHWTSEEEFLGWMKSPEFLEGHKRGFEDVRKAKEEGRKPPMESTFKTYSVLCQ
jgi:heme oxygenase (mycobilin-producing)